MSTKREFKPGALGIQHCISLRHFGPYEKTSETWAKLTQFAFQNGIAGPDVVAFGITYDDPSTTPADQVRYDACLSLSKRQFDDLSQRLQSASADDSAGIRLEDVQIGKTTMTVHRGAYHKVRDAYTDAIHGMAFKALNVHTKGPFIEVYRNNPVLTRAEDLITEVHFRNA